MKALGVILTIFGIGNIIRGVAIMSNDSMETYEGQGIGLFLLGFVFIGGSIYSFYRAAQKKVEKAEFDKWNNPEESSKI